MKKKQFFTFFCIANKADILFSNGEYNEEIQKDLGKMFANIGKIGRCDSFAKIKLKESSLNDEWYILQGGQNFQYTLLLLSPNDDKNLTLIHDLLSNVQKIISTNETHSESKFKRIYSQKLDECIQQIEENQDLNFQSLQKKFQSTQATLEKSVHQLIQKYEKLEEIKEKTQTLTGAAEKFKQDSKKVSDKMQSQANYYKLQLFLLIFFFVMMWIIYDMFFGGSTIQIEGETTNKILHVHKISKNLQKHNQI